ncbi:MAG: ExeA family protein, partial [Vicinamibacteria bacterium]
MYTDHFGLERNPFTPLSTVPPPFASKELQEALAHFLYAQKNREGFFLLVGEVGTGKSTAIRAILDALGPETPAAVLRHTSLDARELLEEVLRRFGLETRGPSSKPVFLERLEQFLAPLAEGTPAVLIIDEAHLLSHAALEEVRLLSNLKHGDRPLLQICLVGQPELLNRLRQHRLRPLRQRIAVRYIVGSLSREETREYIAHRLKAAGSADPDGIFSAAAADTVHELTEGLPREINVVAGQAMLNAYLENAPVVHPQHVRSTKRDYGFEG